VQSSGIPVSDASTVPPTAIDPALLHTLQVLYKTLANQLTQLIPRQPYILVDSARNHLYIKWGDQVILDALAPTGSGTILVLSYTDGNPWQWATQRGRTW
jgi:L,D-transpeptidase YbiS